MAEMYKGVIPILDVSVAEHRDILFDQTRSFGMVPRDYSKFPETMYSSPDEMKVIDQSEWDARYDEQEEQQSSLEHIYLSGPNGQPRFVNLDQNGQGYCWSYSTHHSYMLNLLKQGIEPPRVNPHAVANIIKGGRDEGGWCGLSIDFVRKNGVALEGDGSGQWPLHAMGLKYDTPQLRAEMAKRKITQDWFDLTKQVYDQKLTTKQLATCGFNNIPAPSDFNWWGHSVCQVRWVRIEKGVWGPLILNSWLNWGRFGLAVLRGSKAIADGAVATRWAT